MSTNQGTDSKTPLASLLTPLKRFYTGSGIEDADYARGWNGGIQACIEALGGAIAAPPALPQRKAEPVASITESETHYARREGYVEGWNECLDALGGAIAAPEPPARGFPSERSAEHEAWINEAMRQINALTPNVTGKAFDPDWFLLRQHLEGYPPAAPQAAIGAPAEQLHAAGGRLPPGASPGTNGTPAEALPPTDAQDWAIDQSAGSDILVYKRCSVIQDEQAHFVLGLVSAALANERRGSPEPELSMSMFAKRQDYEAARSGPAAQRAAIQELRNIVNAERFNKDAFEDDTAFADWAQSRARHTLATSVELDQSTPGAK